MYVCFKNSLLYYHNKNVKRRWKSESNRDKKEKEKQWRSFKV